jgi:integrase
LNIDLKVTLPPKKPVIKNLPTAEQVICMIRGTDIELPCMLSMWLSLRISEVRGLQFGDIKDGVMTVQRSKLSLANKDVVRSVNKTYSSTRKLVVPQYIMDLINAVPHQSDEEFIVPMNYQVIKYHLNKLTAEHGYTMTLHDFRHMNASIMLMLGVPDKYAMERGGWCTNATLKAVYQHTFSDERRHVDEKIDGFFEGLLGVSASR